MLSADARRCVRECIDIHRSAIADHRDAIRGHERAARMVESLVARGGISRTAVRSALAAHNRAMALHRRAADEHDNCIDELDDLLDRSVPSNPANGDGLKDIHNSQSLQTSAGVTKGTSSYTPLSRAQRQAELLALAGPVVGDGGAVGGAVGAAAIRDAEFIRRLAHCQAVAAAGSALYPLADPRGAARKGAPAGPPIWVIVAELSARLVRGRAPSTGQVTVELSAAQRRPRLLRLPPRPAFPQKPRRRINMHLAARAAAASE